ncbi:hypothetical protein JJL45_11670 [Tamlana sp. s12]|uniref:hypothetical protein n=1 Tax=Tamlana sp. s12 TaxID=1630406 RepID=UPI0008006B98|nr:hypothetical protein [Tamlana sp. s12]OBQ46125.1 hypothetical protein VQ01_15685 [Tamlana sp. s12]QQY81580.1 hypothetical protein JJL45_11670 [Tamlana sp. s12]
MKKINLILILFTLIFQSCNNDDCGECFTPPQSFQFEIVDKTSGENLFTNGTYDSGNIEITDNLNDNEPIEFTFISENNINLIQIGSIGWETEIVNLKIDISDNHIFDFYVDAERKMGECCSYTEYNEITIGESEFELDSENGIYKILVE